MLPEQCSSCVLSSCSDLLVGVRHILDVEDPSWLLREDVRAGLGLLQERGLAFDLLVRPPTLKHVPAVGRYQRSV